MFFYILQIPFVLYFFNILEKKYLTLHGTNNKLIIQNILGIYHSTYVSFGTILYVFNIISINIYDIILFHSVLYNLRDTNNLLKSNNKMKNEMLFHHTILISSCVMKKILDNEILYTYYLSLNFLSEISTPTLNLSQILYYNNNKKSFFFFL